MEIEFEDDDLDRLEIEAGYYASYSAAIVTAYRKRIQMIRAALDERTFYAMKSLHFEKLQGDRYGQYSMRLNDQWRLIIRLKSETQGKIVVVVSIKDYH